MTLLVMCVTGAWAQTTTLFDAADANWSAYTKYASENVTYGGVTWHFGSSASYASGSSTIAGVSWDGRVKLGGSSTFKTGSTLARLFTFTPASAGVVKVYCVHGSDSGTRTTYISQSITSTNKDTETALGSYAATPEAKSGVAQATVEAGKMVYVWADNNVGIYGITFTPSATYTVTYKANGSGESDVVDDEASTVAANPFTYAGHAFTGWNTEDDGTGTDYAVGASVTADLTLYAQWDTSYDITKGTHTNGDFTITPASAAAGAEITLAATPSSGYDFASWTILKTSDDSDVTDAVSLSSSTAATATFTLPAYGVTVNATFEAAKYTVTYDVNGGGSCATASEKQASAGAAVTLPTPTWAGYTFDGWYNAGTKIGDAGDSYTPTANITLYAKWTDNIEGKIFSYVDGNYGDKFQAFDGSGWVTASPSDKDKTFTDGTTGAKFVIVKGAWDNKTNSISALVKLVGSGDHASTMSVVIPAGYQAQVKILYGSYNTSRKLTIGGTEQTASVAAFTDAQTNQEIAADMTEVTLDNQSGTLTLGSSSGNIYIARVAVVLTHVTGTITASGWNTFSSSHALDLSNVTNGTAYVASAAEGSTVTLTPVTDKIVEAGTGLMIKGTADDVFAIGMTAEAATFSGTNKLEGLPTGGTVAKDNHNYVFGWSDPADPGFYLVNATEPVLAAGKAYLHADNDLTVGARLSIDFGEGDVTAINKIEAAKQNVGEYFNLAGQRIAQPTKGLYIVNGKKVVLK